MLEWAVRSIVFVGGRLAGVRGEVEGVERVLLGSCVYFIEK